MSNELLKDALDPRLNSGSDTRRGPLQCHREHCDGSMGVSTTPEDKARFEHSTRPLPASNLGIYRGNDMNVSNYQLNDDPFLTEHYMRERLMAELDSLPNADEAKHWLEVYKHIVNCTDVACSRIAQVIAYFSACAPQTKRAFLRERSNERINKMLAEYRRLKSVQDADKHGDEVDAILKQRQGQWGDAYKQIADDWNSVLGTQLTSSDFIAMMLLMKLRRWKNSGYKEQDCLTDIIGYAKLGLSLSTDA